MLAILGPVVFNLLTDMQSISMESGTTLARHDVINSSPVYEATGEEESTVTIQGTVHPFFAAQFGLSATSGYRLLEAARLAKTPLSLMRGTYEPLGWFLIRSIKREDNDLDASTGVGQEVSYTIDLVRVGTPGTSLAAAILRLF